MINNKSSILTFSDKRQRETRLRRSVVAIDDTDFLMEVRSARRRSIDLMNNDDMDLYPRSPTDWNRVWYNFKRSPENVRSMMASNTDKNRGRICEQEEAILRNPIPDLLPKIQDDKIVITVETSSSNSSSSPSVPSPSSLAPQHRLTTTAGTAPDDPQRPSWYKRLGAISRRQRQQEKAYHDTLDEHHEAKTFQALKKHQNHPYFQYWNRSNSIRDGMDFSREVTLAMRHDSIYACADSLTQLPLDDAFHSDSDMNNANNGDENENGNFNFNSNNGYIQDTRPAVSPKTKQCVLNLIE